jgi:hypothetical protein
MKVDRNLGQPSKGLRRGSVFSVRVTDAERATLEAHQRADGGPRGLGPWMLWRALQGKPPGRVVPGPGPGNTGSIAPAPVVPSQAVAGRIILDLCGGSGSWAEPYKRAGYDVRTVTLPDGDVRTYVPPPKVWGVLAAPPCTEFSLAKNGSPRDFMAGMETVNACMRVILQCRPQWWALENPTGYLAQFLGTPADVWEPYQFGDPWTKRTAIWGEFQLPTRGPFVVPTGSAMDRPNAAARAVTPPGFANAFFRANP